MTDYSHTHEAINLVTGPQLDFVQKVWIPRLNPLSEVVIWGSRTFVNTGSRADGDPLYKEVLLTYIMPIPGFTDNGLN